VCAITTLQRRCSVILFYFYSCDSFLADGARFVPRAKGSEWEETRAEDGGLQKRILSCPPGYELHRDDKVPELDDCKRCENGFYLLETSFWTGPNSVLPKCRSCNSARASCSGEDNIEALNGFWRMQFGYVDDHEYLADSFCGILWAEGEVCMFPEGSFYNCFAACVSPCYGPFEPERIEGKSVPL
jgi:hypothetical protein